MANACIGSTGGPEAPMLVTPAHDHDYDADTKAAVEADARARLLEDMEHTARERGDDDEDQAADAEPAPGLRRAGVDALTVRPGVRARPLSLSDQARSARP